MAGQRRRVVVTPRAAGIAGCLIAAVLGYGAITVIVQARGAIGAQWRPAVLTGGGASVGLLALIPVLIALARRGPRASRALAPVAMGLGSALALICWAGLHVIGLGGPVTSPWEVGLAACVVPVAVVAVVATPLLTWRRRPPSGGGASPRHVIVATITRRGGDWSVHWTGLGRTPSALRAPTLTDSVKAAEGALLALGLRRDTDELRMVIYPGRYRGGLSFEVADGADGLTATGARDPAQILTGVSMGDLVTAIEQTLPGDSRGFRLRWSRPVAVLRGMAEPPTGGLLPPGTRGES